MRVRKIFGSIFLLISVIFLASVALELLSGRLFNISFVRSNLILSNLLAMLFFSVVFVFIVGRGKLKSYGLRISFSFPFGRVVIYSLILGFVSGLIITVADFSIENAPWADMSNLQMVINVWIIASITEEVLFRGLIQGYLHSERRHGFKLGKVFLSLPVIVSAILFGLLHLMLLTVGADPRMVAVVIVFATFMGVIAGYYREKSNSLLPAILIHACFNIGGSFMALLI